MFPRSRSPAPPASRDEQCQAGQDREQERGGPDAGPAIALGILLRRFVGGDLRLDPIEVPDLYATILAVLGVEYAQEVITPIGRPLALCEGTPIERLLLPST